MHQIRAGRELRDYGGKNGRRFERVPDESALRGDVDAEGTARESRGGVAESTRENVADGTPDGRTGGERRDNETCANLAKMIEKCFRDARALDLESLCVSAGRYAWHLRLDVTILNHGGDLPLAVSVGGIAL